MNKKYIRTLGRDLKRTKTWEKATDIGSSVTKNAGSELVPLGMATGNPELIAVGGGLIASSKLLKTTNKLLKKKKKNKN